jgi:hypothetical protein
MNNTTKSGIISRFPSIKLSYEIVHYNKVLSNFVFFAIPKGIKCFLWLTQERGKECCYVLYLDNKKNIIDVKRKTCCFDRTLSKGTIFYGTYFVSNNKSIFAIEDLFYYKGTQISCNLMGKLELICSIKNYELNSIGYNKNCLSVGIPICSLDYNELLLRINNLQYTVYCIQKRSDNKLSNMIKDNRKFEKNESTLNSVNKLNDNIVNNHTSNNAKMNKYSKCTTTCNIKTAVFSVKADLKPDTYNLYCLCNKNYVFYDSACIADFKTSEYMNTTFRNIKENSNLDALEESDDEDEFQNEEFDKFVNLDKSIIMKCVYNTTFNMWSPIEEMQSNVLVSHIDALPKITSMKVNISN